MGAEVRRYERFVFLFLALVCLTVCGDSNFWSILNLIESC